MSYSRVYHDILDDAKFADVYHDDRRLALWLRLLIGADQAWPAPAVLPRSAHRASLRHLTDVGLVLFVGKDHYRIKGMHAERERRSQSASHAARNRWGNAGRNAENMPSKAEQSRTEQSMSSSMRRCPNDPNHNTILVDGQTWCMPCHQAIA